MNHNPCTVKYCFTLNTISIKNPEGLTNPGGHLVDFQAQKKAIK